MKRQPTEWKKISANHISEKRLISKTCKDITQFNSKKTNNSNKNSAKHLNRQLSSEHTQMANGTKKGAQHHYASGKRKSKPQ